MYQKLIRLFSAAAVTLITLNACVKGDTGPEGPQGPAGPQGTSGVEGPAGNGNVKGFGPFVIQKTAWTAPPDSMKWITSITLAAVTQDIVDRGAVQVYIKDAAGLWWQLPYSYQDEYMLCGMEPGKVNLMASNSHGTYPPRPETATYRVVVLTADGKVVSPDVFNDAMKNSRIAD
jgi:hypothetical protein